MRTTRIFGHRGAKGFRPQNTMAAFEHAIMLGCDGIELDVFCTTDNEIVVFHDQDTLALTGVPGRIADMNWAQVQELRVSGETIPRLQEVLLTCAATCTLNIELKDQKSTPLVAEMLLRFMESDALLHSPFIISSFIWDNLRWLSRHYPEIPLGVLSHNDLDAATAFAKEIKAKAIHPHFSELSPAKIQALQQQGFEVNTWTVNDAPTRKWLTDAGVDAIITDYPVRS